MIAARKIYINVARNLWNSVQRMGDEQVPREIVRGIGGSQVRRNFGQVSVLWKIWKLFFVDIERISVKWTIYLTRQLWPNVS